MGRESKEIAKTILKQPKKEVEIYPSAVSENSSKNFPNKEN
jgi:hypothetical protein